MIDGWDPNEDDVRCMVRLELGELSFLEEMADAARGATRQREAP